MLPSFKVAPAIDVNVWAAVGQLLFDYILNVTIATVVIVGCSAAAAASIFGRSRCGLASAARCGFATAIIVDSKSVCE
jgi:hypothetical protein